MLTNRLVESTAEVAALSNGGCYHGRVRIVIAGGTGFLGRVLVSALQRHGHEVTVLTRRTRHLPPGHVTWNPDGSAGAWASALDGAAAVVNLAGEPLVGARWTEKRKREIRDSRVLATRSLVTGIAESSARPQVFVSGSAVGYYGARGAEEVGEDAPAGPGFLGDVCQAWEAEAAAVQRSAVRLVVLRTGLVLAPDGGLLRQMLWPFKFGLGSVLGTGDQYMSWIHRRDWIDLVRWSLLSDSIHGTFNATAPEPVTNRAFTEAVATAVRRPHVLRLPPFALRLALGDMADSILTGQRAMPRRPLALGFHFRWPELAPALRDLLA